jgi:hypothetical protein
MLNIGCGRRREHPQPTFCTTTKKKTREINRACAEQTSGQDRFRKSRDSRHVRWINLYKFCQISTDAYVSSIWGRTKSHLWGIVWGSSQEVTWPEVTSVTWWSRPCPEVCSTVLLGPFHRTWRESRDFRKRSCPEVCSAHARFITRSPTNATLFVPIYY